MPADLILERMESAAAAFNIVVLDACRDNPFTGSRSASRGLSVMSSRAVGTLIAFATSPGGTAADNPGGRNGLFTKYIVEALKIPGLTVEDVFDMARKNVYLESSGRQIPWTSSSLLGEFYFRPTKNARGVGIWVDREPSTGILGVTLNMGGAELYIGGVKIAVSEGPETLYVKNLPVGDYRVRIAKEGYSDIVKSVEVKKDLTSRINAWLK